MTVLAPAVGTSVTALVFSDPSTRSRMYSDMVLRARAAAIRISACSSTLSTMGKILSVGRFLFMAGGYSWVTEYTEEK